MAAGVRHAKQSQFREGVKRSKDFVGEKAYYQLAHRGSVKQSQIPRTDRIGRSRHGWERCGCRSPRAKQSQLRQIARKGKCFVEKELCGIRLRKGFGQTKPISRTGTKMQRPIWAVAAWPLGGHHAKQSQFREHGLVVVAKRGLIRMSEKMLPRTNFERWGA